MNIDRPLLVFDGECRFCRRWVARWRRRTKDRVAYAPFQKLGSRWPQISREACQNAVQFLDHDGRIYSGADAIAQLFRFGLPGGRIATFLTSHPPIIWAMRLGYRIVAANRQWFSRMEIGVRQRLRRHRFRLNEQRRSHSSL